jgi:hypothetical protein
VNLFGFDEHCECLDVYSITIMAKIPYLQFVRTFFVLATLAGFSASNLIACMCAPKKIMAGGISRCNKVPNGAVRGCCKNKPAKKSTKKRCKMLCCKLARKQDGIVENVRGNAVLSEDASSLWVFVHYLNISNKPLYRAVVAEPCAAELCVFLC